MKQTNVNDLIKQFTDLGVDPTTAKIQAEAIIKKNEESDLLDIKTSVGLLNHYIEQHDIKSRVGYYLQGGKIKSDAQLENDILIWAQQMDVKPNLTNKRNLLAAFGIKSDETFEERKAEVYDLLKYDAKALIEVVDGEVEYLSHFDLFEAYSGLDFLSVKVIEAWIWNVKRVMIGEPSTQVPMPVFHSTKQGTGKSYFVKELCKPLEEFAAQKKVSEISDKHNISWGRLLVADFDEMAGLEKTDMNTLKTWITQDKMHVRKMHSELYHYIDKITQPIGSSNHDIQSIVWDTTGTRRFYQIDIPECGKWLKMVKRVDFKALWQSVDEFAPNPLSPYKDQVFSKQQTQRKQHVVEMWWHDEGGKWVKDARIQGSCLWGDFKAWCFDNGHDKGTNNMFGRNVSKYLSEFFDKPSKTNSIYVKLK